MSIWDEKPTTGNKVILTEEGDEFTGQVRERGEAYVERFKKDVPTVTFEDGTEEGLVFEGGLTVWRNALLRIQPQPGDWLRIWRGKDKGSYTDGGVEKVEAPEGGQSVRKSAPKAETPPPVNKPAAKKPTTNEPPF